MAERVTKIFRKVPCATVLMDMKVSVAVTAKQVKLPICSDTHTNTTTIICILFGIYFVII